MSEGKHNFLYYFLVMILITSGIAGGGFFCGVSAVLSIILMVLAVCILIRSGEVLISFDVNFAAIAILTLGYFIVGLWAVDSGMSLMGGIKFLPVLIYFFIMCQILDQREQLIRILPVLGSLMTIFSFVMMQFPAFLEYVSVAGRLAGFFQYPNTYALFMLICLLISVYQISDKKIDWMTVIHIFIALTGIYLSGSRTVMVLTILVFFLLLILRKELRKYSVLCVGVFVILVGILAFLGYGKGIYDRLLSMAGNASTFWGRLLYDRDAVKMIVTHPLGMGYYGYYFVQQEMQTGVYSVVSVHNELLQIMLDIGIVPAFLVYGAILRSLLAKDISERNRIILAVMLVHSLFDYDFQFLVMFFVLLLFLEVRNVKKIKISILSKITAGLALVVAVVLSVVVGVSDFFYSKGEPERAIDFYSGNTMARIDLLNMSKGPDEMEKQADSILESNSHVSVAYSAKARVSFSRGDVEAFIRYKLTAIRLAPYQYEEYVDYLNSLVYCVKLYRQADDMESVRFCAERAAEIPHMLEDVKERTSSLGWKINDQPEVTLSKKELELIEETIGIAEQYNISYNNNDKIN